MKRNKIDSIGHIQRQNFLFLSLKTSEESQIVMSVLVPKHWTTVCFVPAGTSVLRQSCRMGIYIGQERRMAELRQTTKELNIRGLLRFQPASRLFAIHTTKEKSGMCISNPPARRTSGAHGAAIYRILRRGCSNRKQSLAEQIGRRKEG